MIMDEEGGDFGCLAWLAGWLVGENGMGMGDSLVYCRHGFERG